MHLSNDANERTTILLVEDERLLRDMLEETLTEAGFAVLSAASGEEAVSLLGGMSMPWALVTDIKLGCARMDGWARPSSAPSRFRLRDPVRVRGQHAPLAANGVPNSMFLPKPFAPAQLVEAVSSLLNRPC